MPSEPKQLLRRLDHARRRRDVRVLDRPEGEGDVVAGNTDNRAAQVEDRLLCEERRDLGAEARDARRFLEDDRAPRLRDRREQRVLVERLEGTNVDDLDARLE